MLENIGCYLGYFGRYLGDNQGILIVIFTGLIAYLNYRLASETRRIRKLDSEPNIEVYLVPHDQSTAFINMVIRNSGNGAVRNIKWDFVYDREDVEKKGIAITDMNLFRILHYIPAKEEFRFYFGQTVKLLSDPVMKPIEIKVVYENDDKKKLKKKIFIIDIEPWRGMKKIGENIEYNKMKSLQNIEILLKTVLSGCNPPLFRVQNEKDYQRDQSIQRKEAEEYFEKNGG